MCGVSQEMLSRPSLAYLTVNSVDDSYAEIWGKTCDRSNTLSAVTGVIDRIMFIQRTTLGLDE
jgi:hypothetical protein